MNETLKKYFMEFEELPPLVIPFDYENEIYQKLMNNAIERGEPISNNDLDEALKDVKYDYVESSKIKIKEKK